MPAVEDETVLASSASLPSFQRTSHDASVRLVMPASFSIP